MPYFKRTWKRRTFTPEERVKGGLARAARLSKHRRQEIARKGYLAMLIKRALKEAQEAQEKGKAS
jgi:hypothetical protein